MKTLILGLMVTFALTTFWLVAMLGAALAEAGRLRKSRRD